MSAPHPVAATATPDVERPHELPPEVFRTTTRLLRTGLLLALTTLALFAVVYVIGNPTEGWSQVINQNPVRLYLSASGLASGLFHLQVEAYLTLGVLFLIATPVARVLAGAFIFRANGERTMTRITLAVLGMLLIGLFIVGPLVR
ncbi:MAG: DUF1634 domain-containing protein [Thermoplasmata archaeon]